jgi:hypothetical protein
MANRRINLRRMVSNYLLMCRKVPLRGQSEDCAADLRSRDKTTYRLALRVIHEFAFAYRRCFDQSLATQILLARKHPECSP